MGLNFFRLLLVERAKWRTGVIHASGCLSLHDLVSGHRIGIRLLRRFGAIQPECRVIAAAVQAP